MMTMLSHLVHTNNVTIMNVTCEIFLNNVIYSYMKIETLTTRPIIMTSPS